MKFNCGLTLLQEWEDYNTAKQEFYHNRKTNPDSGWEDFYAVWPRRVARQDCRFLELIERRIKYFEFRGHTYEYRAKPR